MHNLKIEFINKLIADFYMGEYGQNAPKYKAIRYVGHATINSISNGTHYNGECYTYIMDTQGELICFDIYLNKNNGQKGKWDYVPRLWLKDYFPTSNKEEKQRIFDNISLDVIDFLGNNIEV